jgi:hypothetical protein
MRLAISDRDAAVAEMGDEDAGAIDAAFRAYPPDGYVRRAEAIQDLTIMEGARLKPRSARSPVSHLFSSGNVGIQGKLGAAVRPKVRGGRASFRPSLGGDHVVPREAECFRPRDAYTLP